MSTGEHEDRPGVIALPPVIYGVAALAGLALEWLARWRITAMGGRAAAVTAGALLGLLFIVLAIWAERTMHRAGTNVLPTRPTTAIVRNGPFRYTRNPIYLGVTLGYVGACLLLNTGWPLVTLPFALLVMEFGVVRREERYLERKFGDEYRAYRRSVRRWI